MRVRARGVAAMRGLTLWLGLLLADTAPAADWSTIVDGRLSYTDDVFQFSVARRQKFSEDPSQPTVVPVEKQSDFVWDPSLEVKRTSGSALGPTEVGLTCGLQRTQRTSSNVTIGFNDTILSIGGSYRF